MSSVVQIVFTSVVIFILLICSLFSGVGYYCARKKLKKYEDDVFLNAIYLHYEKLVINCLIAICLVLAIILF